MNNHETPNTNDPTYLAMRALMTHPKARTCVECGCDYPPLIYYRDDLDTVGIVYAHATCTNCGRTMNGEHDPGWSMRFRDAEARLLRKTRGFLEPFEIPCPHVALADRKRAALEEQQTATA